jgi:hypothetical protein
LNAVKNKFENYESQQQQANAPKPIRSITPPRDGLNKSEIENEPMQRAPEIVSSADRRDEPLPESGIARSRKEMFQHIADTSYASNNNDSVTGGSGRGHIKAITPPRDDIVRRVLKEVTPDRNENVTRESDRNDDALPSAGTAKQTAALFTSNSLHRSIERSGISIEGELAEKGIAKSRLAMFANNAQTTPSKDGLDVDDDMRNASGIAKERLNLFKNLEQQTNRTSPPKELKKFKEFTPPPQLEPHQLQQRQYIIVVSYSRV